MLCDVVGCCVIMGVVLWDVVGALFDIRFVLGLFDVGVSIGICNWCFMCLLVCLCGCVLV